MRIQSKPKTVPCANCGHTDHQELYLKQDGTPSKVKGRSSALEPCRANNCDCPRYVTPQPQITLGTKTLGFVFRERFWTWLNDVADGEPSWVRFNPENRDWEVFIAGKRWADVATAQTLLRRVRPKRQAQHAKLVNLVRKAKLQPRNERIQGPSRKQSLSQTSFAKGTCPFRCKNEPCVHLCGDCGWPLIVHVYELTDKDSALHRFRGGNETCCCCQETEQTIHETDALRTNARFLNGIGSGDRRSTVQRRGVM